MRTGFAVALLSLALPAGALEQLPALESLNFPTDVRTLGMGETAAAIAAGAGALTANPAALSSIDANQLYFTHSFLHSGIGGDQISYALRAGRHRAGFTYLHYGYGTLEGRDDAGSPDVNFGPSDTIYGFSYGTRLLGADLGAMLKYVDSTIVGSAQAVTFDLGATYQWGEQWLFGLTGQNLGGELKFEGDNAPLPTRVAVGAGWKPLAGLLLGLDVVHPVYSPSYVALGSEYAMSVGDAGSLALRLGLNTRSSDLGAFSGLKLGLGFHFKFLDLDYAFSPSGELGDGHHLGLGYRFDWPKLKR